jgi:catechol 2,3-dioxygenase-like lactoylglutathione lyase family enzyme
VANQNGRPIAPARKLVAAVLGTIAVFVMVFGLGLASWAIVVLGLAMLALSIALGLVNVVRRGARAWVTGTAQVKAVSEPPASSVYGRAELQLVVVAPGLPVTEVLVRDPRVPVDKWPHPGETLPVTVDVDDMRRVRIDWLNAPDRADPPPPRGSYVDVPYVGTEDDYDDDDLLGEPEPPPWATRDRQWGLDPDEPPPPPPPGVAAAGDMSDLRDSPVVVHDTPAGPVVEGQLVGAEEPPPLPKRARSGPIPAQSSPPDAPAEPRSDRPRPSPRPRPAAAQAGAATATVDRETDTHGPFAAKASSGTGTASPEAPGGRAQTGPAPEQRPSPESPPDEPRVAVAEESRPAEPPVDPAGDSHPAEPPVDLSLDEPEPATPAEDEPVVRASGAGNAPSAVPASTDRAHEPEIDLALDGDPEPPPETTPAARAAVAEDLVAPPADGTHEAADRTADELHPDPDAIVPADGPDPDETVAATGPDPDTTVAASTWAREEPAPAEAAPSPAQATGSPEPVAEVPAAERPTISGVDAPPSDAAATAAGPAGAGAEAPPSDAAATAAGPAGAGAEVPPSDAAGAVAGASAAAGAMAGASAAHTGNGPAETDQNPPRRPWADLEGGYEPDDRTDEVITAYPSARPGPAGAIHGVGITVLVTDLERSVAFYRDILGFFEIDSGPGSAVLASGDTRLVLRTVRDLSAEAGRLIYLNLEVGDVEAVYEELKAKGVTFVHAPRPVNRGDKLELWAASFSDPDRHNIAITQWRAVR